MQAFAKQQNNMQIKALFDKLAVIGLGKPLLYGAATGLVWAAMLSEKGWLVLFGFICIHLSWGPIFNLPLSGRPQRETAMAAVAGLVVTSVMALGFASSAMVPIIIIGYLIAFSLPHQIVAWKIAQGVADGAVFRDWMHHTLCLTCLGVLIAIVAVFALLLPEAGGLFGYLHADLLAAKTALLAQADQLMPDETGQRALLMGEMVRGMAWVAPALILTTWAIWVMFGYHLAQKAQAKKGTLTVPAFVWADVKLPLWSLALIPAGWVIYRFVPEINLQLIGVNMAAIMGIFLIMQGVTAVHEWAGRRRGTTLWLTLFYILFTIALTAAMLSSLYYNLNQAAVA